MALKDKISGDIILAMKAKDKEKLEALRAVKSAILLVETEKTGNDLSEDVELKILQKLVKQRNESADLYKEQGRNDLAAVEIAQAEVINQYLPAQMDEAEVKQAVQQIINEVGAASSADIGKVMGAAMKKLGGKADGKLISSIAKELLN